MAAPGRRFQQRIDMGGPAWLPGEFWPRGDAEIMPKAVRYGEFGGIEVLRVEEVERPVPGDGQVLVRVKAAGINPSEAVIRTGAVAELFPPTFPSRQEQQSQLDAILRQGGLDIAADVASV
jgi:NADPH:quinone reductase-like Zn-dependent oxidoreductase